MKRSILLAITVLLGLSLTGCGPMSAKMNTRTTKYPDGRVVEEAMSDDAAYYAAAAEAKRALAIDCTSCTPTEKMLMVAIGALADRGFVPRGMNGYELLAGISRDVVSIAPYGALSFVAYQALKRPGVNMGDNSTYSPFEAHQTGSDRSNINIPYRYGSPDAIEVFEPAFMGAE